MPNFYFETSWAKFKSDPSGGLCSALVFLFPIFFLTIKGWSNGVSFILFFVAVVNITRNFKFYFFGRDKEFWIIFMVFLGPFFGELIAQTGRLSYRAASFDGPSRFVLAAVIFCFLSRQTYAKSLLRYFSIGAGLGVLATAISVFVNSEPSLLWDGRASSYFVDPITISCFTLVLMAISLSPFWNIENDQLSLALKLIIILCAVYVLILGASRVAWLAGMCLFATIAIYRFTGRKLLAVVLLFCGFLILTYLTNDIFKTRIIQAHSNIYEFLSGANPDAFSANSFGQRVQLFLLDWELIARYPFFGVEDGWSPSLDLLRTTMPDLNWVSYRTRIVSGSHFEINAQFARQGIIGGMFSVFSLLLFPLIYIKLFSHKQKSGIDLWQMFWFPYLVIVISSFAVQVFNFKMTITFWGIFLGIILAAVYSANAQQRVTKVL